MIRENAKLITANDAAPLLGLSPRSVKRAVERGEIAGVRFGKKILVNASELQKLLAQAGVDMMSQRAEA